MPGKHVLFWTFEVVFFPLINRHQLETLRTVITLDWCVIEDFFILFLWFLIRRSHFFGRYSNRQQFTNLFIKFQNIIFFLTVCAKNIVKKKNEPQSRYNYHNHSVDNFVGAIDQGCSYQPLKKSPVTQYRQRLHLYTWIWSTLWIRWCHLLQRMLVQL